PDLSAVVELDTATTQRSILRRSSELALDERYISTAMPITFQGADGLESHGFFYAPKNPDFSGPPDELPPLLVHVHGGPTAHVQTALDLSIQLFTIRALAVAGQSGRRDLAAAAPVARARRQGRAAASVGSDRRRAQAAGDPVRVHRIRRGGPRLPQGGEREAGARGAPLLPCAGVRLRAGG